MANTIQTVWKLQLDESAAREGENFVQRLARTIKDKLGGESTKAIEKTTEAIEEQTEALKKNEEAAKRAADVDRGGRSAATDFSGDVASASGGLRGAADFLGGGQLGAVSGLLEVTEALGDIGEFAPQAASQVASLATSLGPVGLGLAAVAAVAAIAISSLAATVQEEADKITAVGEKRLEIAERIAAGLTASEATEELEQNAKRQEEIQIALVQAQKEYNEFLAQQPDILGNAGDNILKVFDAREAALEKTVTDAQNALKDIATDNQVIQEALDSGRVAADDTAKSEKNLADIRQTDTKAGIDTAKEAAKAQEKAQQDAARAQEKAAADAQRAAEKAAADAARIEEMRYKAAQKYGDALVDIARKSADDAIKAAQELRLKQVDNRRAFDQDIQDMSLDFHASEREEALKRQEEQASDLRQHALKLEGIRDDALNEETDLLRKRDFLGATRVRESANRQIEQENKALVEATEEKRRLQKSEDSQQLRELDKARQDRLRALQRANEEAKIQYQRDVANQRDARKLAEREAAISRDRDLRAASEAARALLGIKNQQAQAELQLAQNVLQGVRGMVNTSVTNNNQRVNNGGVNTTINTNDPRAVQRQIIQTLGEIGLV